MFSIVIPVFNESENIETLVLEITKSLQNYSDFELIIVNDCSTDNSLRILNNLKSIDNIKIINNSIRKGQSFSIHKGIINSNYKTIVTLDGDGQNDPKDIPKLLEIYFAKDNLHLVAGIRKTRKDNLIKKTSSYVANKIRSRIFNDGCDDTGCSLKVFDKNIFLKFPYFNGIHRFLPSLFVGYNYNPRYVMVSHRPRKKGISNYGTFDRLYRGVIDIIKVIKIIKNRDNK